MSKIYISLPNQNWLHRFTVQKLIEMAICHDEDEEKHSLQFDFEANKPIDCNRNSMIKRFLETDYEWFLTMDADNPPIGNPLERIALNKDIVAFPTPIWYSQITARANGESPIVWNCFDWHENDSGWREHHPQQGLQEIDAAGTGCMLIHRRVLEHEEMKPAFYREWDDDGIVTGGSDLVFCKRAKAAGFGVWADYSCACSHYKELDMTQIYNLMKIRDVGYINQPNINTRQYWDKRWSDRLLADADRVQRGCDNKPGAVPDLDVYPYVVERAKEGMNGNRPYKILDFGCGAGALLDKLAGIEGVELYGMDISQTAIDEVKRRGYCGAVGSRPVGQYDLVIATELLEHVDNNEDMLNMFFLCAPRVIYTVPNNCMPPGLEREHRRVFSTGYCERTTPHVQEISVINQRLMVVADKNRGDKKDGGIKQIVNVC